MKIVLAVLLVFIINLPFGYWRYIEDKFSLKWFLAIHIPVIFVVLIRIYAEVGFEWYTYPIFITAFYLGQLVGGKLRTAFAD